MFSRIERDCRGQKATTATMRFAVFFVNLAVTDGIGRLCREREITDSMPMRDVEKTSNC
jgi:hypothetical protein